MAKANESFNFLEGLVMANRRSFYTVPFDSRDTGRTEVSRTFSTKRGARGWAVHYRGFADNVRIMRGGPGGVEVA